jgi:hypothetical protein
VEHLDEGKWFEMLVYRYTPPGATTWHQNVTRRVALAMKSQRAMSFNLVRRG